MTKKNRGEGLVERISQSHPIITTRCEGWDYEKIEAEVKEYYKTHPNEKRG
jgi:hypothetical protein